ncbi:hypothetical protein Tco_0569141 [Tanacetum coccineum]
MQPKDTLSSCLDSEEQDMQQMLNRAKILKGSCLISLSALKLNFTQKHVQGITKSEFEHAFSRIFGEDVDTFIRTFFENMGTLEQQPTKETILDSNCQNAFRVLKTQFEKIFTSVLIKPSSLDGTMFLNMDQLEKQFDHEEFQEIGYMASFRVLETQFQTFIKSRICLDDEYVIMTRNYFLEYTQLEIPEFRDTLIQHMDYVKKLIDKRALHKREYGHRVNERQMQSIEEKVDTSKALDANFKPIYKEEPMAEVQMTADDNVSAIGQHHTEQPEFNNEGEVDRNAEQCKVKHDIHVIETINIELEHKVAKLLTENETLKKHYKDLYDSIKVTRTKTIEQTTSLIAKNDEFKAQLQEKGFTIAALKNKLRKLSGNSVNSKFANQSILGKPVLQPHRNKSVVRQLTAFKSERPRISKPRFASQIDVNKDLSKPVTTHYLPKEKESASAKPHHVIASSNSRNSSKNMPRFSSNDMVHNHYLEEAKKKTQKSGRNSRPSVMPYARSQSTANDNKPKPRINNQKSRNWPASKSGCVMKKSVPIAEHSRNSRKFSDSKHFVCSTCQKCVFNANHDACVTKFLNEVNSRAKVPSHKTPNRNKPVKKISVTKKQESQIPTGYRFSIKKTSVVHEKTTSPRTCLRWKQTGRIFNIVGLRWVPTGKIFTSSTTMVDSEPPHGSNTDITNLCECIQNLDSSASTSINVQEEQILYLNEGSHFNLKKERIKVSIKENVISGRPRLHGTTLIQETSARQSSQGIRSLLTS